MSDLSRLLEDVYRTSPVDEDASPALASGPTLAEMFADWVPVPPADAPEPEPEPEVAYTATEPDDDRLEPHPPETIPSVFDVDGYHLTDVDHHLQALLAQTIPPGPEIVDDDTPEPEALEPVTYDLATTELPPETDEEQIQTLLDQAVGLAPDVDDTATADDVAPLAPAILGTWCRRDDDVLPSRRRFGLRLR